MALFHPGAYRRRGRDCAVGCASRSIARVFPAAVCGLILPFAVFCQDNGSAEKESFGNGVAISVTVHDDSGVPIPTPATVKLLQGTLPTAQTETSRGNAVLIVNKVGEFTLLVNAPGFREAQKDISIGAAGNAQVDVYLRRAAEADKASSGAGAGPLLAPKAKEALDKGLAALGADKTGEADKQIGLAMKLAPGHPDVLYAQGVLWIKEQNWARAQSVLEKATQIDPGHARAFAALGMALCDQGKYSAAILPLEKSLKMDAAGTSRVWEAQWALAKAYYGEGQYAKALKTSQSALAGASGKEPRIMLLVAQSLTAAGEYEEAARVLREFVQANGDRKEAATARRWLENLSKDGKIRSAKN